MNKIQKQIANVFTKSYGISAFATVTEDGKPWVRYVHAIPIIWRLSLGD